MSYLISYGDAFNPSKKTHKRRKFGKIAALICFVCAVTVMILFSEIRFSLRDFLLPGDEAVTTQALEAFAEDLQVGTPFPEAIEAFCLTILQDA